METSGYVMGEETLDGEDVDGYVMGEEIHVVGRGRRGGSVLRLPPRPAWRGRMAAPGVPSPGEGLEILPLTADINSGVFTALIPGAGGAGIITFSARPQRPFRSERLVAIVTRIPDAGVFPLARVECTGQFVGTQLMQITKGNFDVELFPVLAFGVRQQHIESQPGIDITLALLLRGPALVGAQAIQVTLTYFGRSVQ